MAQMTQYKCDRCGKPITKDRCLFVVESGPLREQLPSGQVDLCSSCGTGFLDWLGHGVGKSVPEKKSPEQEEIPLGPVGRVAKGLPQS